MPVGAEVKLPSVTHGRAIASNASRPIPGNVSLLEFRAPMSKMRKKNHRSDIR